MKMSLFVLTLALGGCDALLDFDKLRDGKGGDAGDNGDGSMAHHVVVDMSGEDLTGLDLATAPPPDFSGMPDLAFDMAHGPLDNDMGCYNTPSGPYFSPDFDEQMTGESDTIQVAVANLDGDNLPEIIFTDRTPEIVVWHNLGSRKFEVKATKRQFNDCSASDGLYPALITIGDFNHDGHLDAVVGCSDPGDVTLGTMYFFAGDGNGNLAAEVEFTNPAIAPYSGVAVDVDVDGATDLVVIDYGTGNQMPGLSVFWGGSTFASQSATHVEAGAQPYTLATAPLGTTDKIPDFVIADYGATGDGDGGYFVVRRSRTAVRTLTPDTKSLAPGSADGIPIGVALGHFNNDKFYDLLAFEQKEMYWSPGAATGTNTTFGKLVSNGAAPSGSPNPFGYTVRDLNCDGTDDIVLTHTEDDGNSDPIDAFDIWKTDSAGALTHVIGFNNPSDTEDVAAAIADFDGDHVRDVLIAVNSSRAEGFVMRFLWGLP